MANSSTEILVTWNEVPLIDQNGLYEPWSIFNDQMTVRVMTVNVTATELSTLLVDLQESVSYCIAVRAYTSVGPGPYSDSVREKNTGRLSCESSIQCNSLLDIINIYQSSLG